MGKQDLAMESATQFSIGDQVEAKWKSPTRCRPFVTTASLGSDIEGRLSLPRHLVVP